jgi:DNA-binding NtrC family response regulator
MAMPRSKKIMVVDDEVGIRELLFDVLSKEGFAVTLAKDGQDSLQLMRNRRFDLVITDIDMPRVNGLELLRRMKRAGRKEKVIIMSGNPLNQKDIKKEILPVITQLDKPFQMDTILEAVSTAFASRNKKSCATKVESNKKRRAINAI